MTHLRLTLLILVYCIFATGSVALANGHIEEFYFPDTLTLNYVMRELSSPISGMSTSNPLVETYTHQITMTAHQSTPGLSNVWRFNSKTYKTAGELVLDQDLYRRIDSHGWVEYYRDPVQNSWKEYQLIPIPIKGGTKWNSTVKISVPGADSPMYRQRNGETLFWEEVTINQVSLWCFKLLIGETLFNPERDEKPSQIIHRYWFNKQVGIVRHEAEYEDKKVEVTELSDVPPYVRLKKEEH